MKIQTSDNPVWYGGVGNLEEMLIHFRSEQFPAKEK